MSKNDNAIVPHITTETLADKTIRSVKFWAAVGIGVTALGAVLTGQESVAEATGQVVSGLLALIVSRGAIDTAKMFGKAQK